MAIHTYECMFLLDPNKSSADWDGLTKQCNGIIERHGGEIVLTRPWGDTKLAYPVKKFRKGSYLLTYFKSEPSKLADMEHDFRMLDAILRHLVLKLHPRIAEEILAQLTGQAPMRQYADPIEA